MLTDEERNTMLDIKAVERELRESREEIRRLKIIITAVGMQCGDTNISEKCMRKARRLVNGGRVETEYNTEKRIAGVRITGLLEV
jgi:hypothetical protein